MIDAEPVVLRIELILVTIATVMAIVMIVAIVAARLVIVAHDEWQQRVRARYAPIVERALDGDPAARAALVAAPNRHRFTITAILIQPLIDDRHPARVAAVRDLVRAISMIPFERLIRSRWWTRRLLGIRAAGLLQARDYTGAIIAALDDHNNDIRNAAMDALTDMQDPASLPAIVARMHDRTLHRGRRAAALSAFGAASEAWVLDLSYVDTQHRFNYAQALSICGSAASRPTLTEWVADARPHVAAAALEALAHIGLDGPAAEAATAALDNADAGVRAMAARALRGWPGRSDAARLARHLDDEWTVAVEAARTLQAMDHAGRAELEARVGRDDLVGELARQMLWEVRTAT